MFDNSKFDDRNEETGLDKDFLELDDKFSKIEDWKNNSRKGCSYNFTPPRLDEDNLTGNTHLIPNYLSNFENDYEPYASHRPSRNESHYNGRSVRSLSVADVKNSFPHRILESGMFHNSSSKMYHELDSSKMYHELDSFRDNSRSISSSNGELKNSDIKFNDINYNDINYNDINYNSKLDKDNLKNEEILNQIDGIENDDIKKELKMSKPLNTSYKCYKQNFFDSQKQIYNLNRATGANLYKTPPFFKNAYGEKTSPQKCGSFSPSILSNNQFDNERPVNLAMFIPDKNSSYGFMPYKIIEKDIIQSNSVFKNRNTPPGPFGNFSSIYKRRSYSEADLSRSNGLRNRIRSSFDADEDIMTLYKKGKFSRSSSESCIDPRTFYKNENHPRIFQINKENVPKPNHSYAQIITRAISSSLDGKLSLGEIYKWIEENFEYYRYANPVWKNSIRHNLSLSKCFKKVPREPGSRGKGGKWMIDKEYLFIEESKKKRRSYGDENETFQNSVEKKSMLKEGYLRNNITTVEYSKFSENKYEEM